MKTYRDEDVIALLRDAVPAAPGAPDRVSMIRRRAEHQRRQIALQVLGATVAVVVLVAGTALYRGHRDGDRQLTTSAALLAAHQRALAEARSYRAEVRHQSVQQVRGQTTPSGFRTYLAVDAGTRSGRWRIEHSDIVRPEQFEPGSETLWLGEALYVTGGAGDRLPIGKWVRYPTPQRLLGSLSDGNVAPREPGIFLSAAGPLHAAGTELVRGVRTTSYTAGLTKGNGTVQVWLDASGLIRRLRVESTGTQGDGRTDTTTTLEIYDIGEPIGVAPPPASDVVDYSEVGLDLTMLAPYLPPDRP